METPLFEITLGQATNNFFSSMTPADLFLVIMPKLKEEFDTEVPKIANQVYSNELSPAAVKFMTKDGKLVALYRREVMRTQFSRLMPFSAPTSYNSVSHNVVCVYDTIFCDKVKEFTNGAIDMEKLAGRIV